MTRPADPDLAPERIVAFLADIFARRGSESYLGEPVTMAEHMLQAAVFAQEDGQPEAVVVAALLHDVGHFTGELGAFSMADVEDRWHEEAGAAVLERVFPPVVTACVRQHVAAKRYLCATDPGYFDLLSAASRHSLSLQGGPMSRHEVEAFEALPDLAQIIKVRTFDDRGKIAGMATPPFAHFAPMILRVVQLT